jgi:hypothetical protein
MLTHQFDDPPRHDPGELNRLRAALIEFRQFVLLYRRTYVDTQRHPTILEESEVVMKARELCDKFGFEAPK